ncbi:MAG: glycosyltransferase family 39 protein [Anaerolineales bacterium]|nr:glycosyltransferase family 39 protein [Anaerolineales bacterium]
MQNKYFDLKTVIVLVIALCVRLLGISSRPIWYDEAIAILFSEKGLGAMLYGTLAPTGAGSANVHPLGYHTLLWGWMKVFGESLVSARMLSVLAGVTAVYLIHKISLELFDAKTARAAALIAALSPFQIHYAQEIRMYAVLVLWLLLATFAFLRGSRSGDWRWWAVFGITSALAQYTHNLAAFFLIPLALTPLLKKDWKTLRSVIVSGCFSILLYSPWLVQLPSQIAKVDQSYWVIKPGISSLFTLFLVFTTNTPLPDAWIPPALTIAILILVTGLMQTIYAKDGGDRANGLWGLYMAFIPPILLFIFSQWIPVYIERALLPSGAFFCIWLAWVIQKTNLPNAGHSMLTGMLAIAFTAGIYQHVTYRDFPYGPFKEMTAYLRENAREDDLILHSNKLSMLPAMYFDRNLPQTFIGDPPGSPSDTLAPATQQVLEIEAKSSMRSALGDSQRVWYVIFQRSIEEYQLAGKVTHPDIEFLNSQYELESQKTWDGLQILLFTKRP